MFQRRVLAKRLMRLFGDVARPRRTRSRSKLLGDTSAGEKLYIALKKRNGRQVQFTPAAPKPLGVILSDMKIYLTDQHKNLNKHLDFLKLQQVMPYDKTLLTEKTTTIHIDCKKNLDALDTKFLFDYKIFPDNIMTFLTQWDAEKRDIQVGDTIVQQVYLPPTKIFSQKIVFGVRITEVINQPEKGIQL
jgi:hypothetical protein